MNSSHDECGLEASACDNSYPTSDWKRWLDIVCIVLALPLLVPLMLCIAAVIKIGSAGPVLFRQERVGYRGRRFICYKFRTMVVNSDPAVHEGHLTHLISSDIPMIKMDSKGDPRLVPCGLLLRMSGLDELPQLINVLRGDMSMVGPRPCLPFEYEKYLPWQRERFNSLPGLTGLWQVSGKNKTTFVEMVRLDIAYTRNRSLWLDLKIMLKTFPVLVFQVQETHEETKTPVRLPRPGRGYFGTISGSVGFAKLVPPSPSAQMTREEVKEEL